MQKRETFKDNQEYLAEFFALTGAQKRQSWEELEAPGEKPAEQKSMNGHNLVRSGW